MEGERNFEQIQKDMSNIHKYNFCLLKNFCLTPLQYNVLVQEYGKRQLYQCKQQ